MKPIFIRLTQAVLFATTMLLLFVTGGCAFLKPAADESRYYLLAAEGSNGASSERQGAGSVVRILPVEVANYLQNRDIVVRDGTNEVIFDLFHEWAEPLNDGIRRVVAEDLQTMPGIRSVFTDPSAPAERPDYVLSVHVLACEGVRAKSRDLAQFTAAWEISRPGSNQAVVAHGIFRPPARVWHSGDYNELADQLSGMLSGFSRELAKAISGMNQGRTKSASEAPVR